MASFQSLWLKLDEEEQNQNVPSPDDQKDTEQEAEDTALMGTTTDTSTVTSVDPKALEAIRNGLSVREDGSFWEDFIKMANNDGLANLLDVRPEQVSQWGSKVKEAWDKVKQLDTRDPAPSDSKEMIPTGDA